MKKLLPQIALVLLLLLLPLLGRAQEIRITGRVVDAATKEPVPFASLSLFKSETGALTDESGNFQIVAKEQFEEDSLIVMTLGYIVSKLPIKTRDSESITVELKRGYLSHPRPIEISKLPHGYYRSQDAFFIQVPKSERIQKIRSVSVYFGSLGLTKEEFRFRIYKAYGQMQPPCVDLLTENIFVSPKKLEGWNTFDFKDYNIAVPAEGFYIALEYVYSEHFNYEQPLADYLPSGTVLYPSTLTNENGFWRYGPNLGWKSIPVTNGDFLKYSSMITVEVK